MEAISEDRAILTSEDLSPDQLAAIEKAFQQVGLPTFASWRTDWLLSHDEVTWRFGAKDTRDERWAGGEVEPLTT